MWLLKFILLNVVLFATIFIVGDAFGHRCGPRKSLTMLEGRFDERLQQGDAIVSPNGKYLVKLVYPCVLSLQNSNEKELRRRVLSTNLCDRLVVQSDGNVVAYRDPRFYCNDYGYDKVKWRSNTRTWRPVKISLNNTGSLILEGGATKKRVLLEPFESHIVDEAKPADILHKLLRDLLN